MTCLLLDWHAEQFRVYHPSYDEIRREVHRPPYSFTGIWKEGAFCKEYFAQVCDVAVFPSGYPGSRYPGDVQVPYVHSEPSGAVPSSGRNQEQFEEKRDIHVREGACDSELYDMCVKDILLLDALDNDFSNFHIYFLLDFIIALGFSPEPADLEPFMGGNAALVSEFMAKPFSEAMLVPMTGEMRNDLSKSLLKYIEYHTESAVNVNSLNVLHELFRM